jgi:carboxyl-terminal processing protease
LAELSDGQLIVAQVLAGLPGAQAGIQVGAQILTWNGQPALDALAAVEPYFGPYSTAHAKRLEQAVFLTRYPVGTRIDIVFRNPGQSQKTITLTAEVDYDSLFAAMPSFQQDEIMLPVQGEVLDASGLGYLQINTFSADYNLMARSWEYYLTQLVDNEIPGLIIDLRTNYGGSGSLALDFASHFFRQEIELSRRAYFNQRSGLFEYLPYISWIKPAPVVYDGPVVLLVSPACVSACEGFVYALTQNDRAVVIGHYGTAGGYGEVGRGQYEMPGGYSMQFPTGRTESLSGTLLIEGVGIQPGIRVPVTYESALGQVDAVLEAALEYLLAAIQ